MVSFLIQYINICVSKCCCNNEPVKQYSHWKKNINFKMVTETLNILKQQHILKCFISIRLCKDQLNNNTLLLTHCSINFLFLSFSLISNDLVSKCCSYRYDFLQVHAIRLSRIFLNDKRCLVLALRYDCHWILSLGMGGGACTKYINKCKKSATSH